MKKSYQTQQTTHVGFPIEPVSQREFWQTLMFRLSVWGLTTAERDVALGLLLGLSNKEIARNRHTTERTVRAQARAVYAKSGQSGRHLLTAFFFKELLRAERLSPLNQALAFRA